MYITLLKRESKPEITAKFFKIHYGDNFAIFLFRKKYFSYDDKAEVGLNKCERESSQKEEVIH